MLDTSTERASLNETSPRDSATVNPVPIEPSRTRSRVPYYLAAILVAVAAGHYLVPAHLSLVHNLLQRLFYVPIVLAAFHYGRRAGLTVALISAALYLPHVLLSWRGQPAYQASQLIEIALFLVVGYVVGILVEQKVRSQQQLRSYEKMALFGSLSRSVIRSLKSPIQALQGMVMTLEPKANHDPALESSLRVIRKEVEQIARIRADLIAMVERKRLRLKKQNLTEILFDFEAQIGVLLHEKRIRSQKQAQQLKLNAMANRPAIVNVLDKLTGIMVEGTSPESDLIFYSGQDSSRIWIGAAAGQVQLPAGYPGEVTLLDYDHFRRYELIPVINVMNNHFGDVRFRWQQEHLVEFMLVFPRKVRLPWYLRDESIEHTGVRLHTESV